MLFLKVTFSTKLELVTQAFTKIPCVNLREHKIILANQKKVVVNGRHWLTQRIICVLKGISA